MADEITIDAFFELLGQSGLISEDQCLALSSEFLAEGARPESARQLADELVKRDVLTLWQADMLLQGKHRGFRLGPYRILRPLGQGGMSKVLLAEHEMMHRRSAIKILPSKCQEDSDLLGRFHSEARAIAALDHPNIVRAYDFNKDVRYGKEIHYLVMEYVEGPDLRRMVEEQGPLDFRKAANFICQAAEGLAHAHAAGFVHRDIKPANLLVDPHGVLKILDLGLAVFTFEAQQASDTSDGKPPVVGTADYVAPEQILDSQTVDGRADIYSLGHTFYFLLTGHRPFARNTVRELLAAHRMEQPEPISNFRPDVPRELEAIIDRMTAKPPGQRFQTAKELAEKLHAWLNDAQSGRGYSRISALMAEASRGKPASESSSTSSEKDTAKNAELELTTIEETPVRAASVGKKSVSPVEKKPAPAKPKSKPATAKPLSSGVAQPDLPKEPVAQDLLSGLPMDDTSLGSTAGQQALQFVSHPSSKKKPTTLDLLKTPWPWAALGCLAVVILLLFLLLPRSSSPPGINGSNIARLSAPVIPHSVSKEEPPPPKARSIEPPPQTQPAQPVASPQTPPPQIPPQTPPAAPPTPPAKAPIPPQPPAKATPIPPAAKQTPINPPLPVGPNAQRPAPGKPPVEEPVNTEELLAGLGQISVRMVHSVDNNAKSSLNQSVLTQAKKAIRQAGLENSDRAAAVLEIELKAASANDQFSVTIIANLKCPAKNGKSVIVWTKSKQVLAGDPRKMRSDQVMKVLKTNASKFAGEFFDQFEDDVRQVREKAGEK